MLNPELNYVVLAGGRQPAKVITVMSAPEPARPDPPAYLTPEVHQVWRESFLGQDGPAALESVAQMIRYGEAYHRDTRPQPPVPGRPYRKLIGHSANRTDWWARAVPQLQKLYAAIETSMA